MIKRGLCESQKEVKMDLVMGIIGISFNYSESSVSVLSM